MSEDLFTSSSNDPEADFLAREQAHLAGLDDDLNLNTTNNVNTTTTTNTTTNGSVNDESESEALDGQPWPTNGISDDSSTNDSGTSTGRPTAVSMPIEPKVEPEKIKKWREEQEQMLRDKDAKESVERDALKAQAKKELEEWYVRHREHLEKSRKANRNSEKEWIAERDANEGNGGESWERISKLCDFNPKSTKTTKDTSRMRSILLQLKANPPANI